MDVHLTARHCDIPDALRQRAVAAFETLASQEPRISFCNVVFEDGREQRAVAAVCGIQGVGSAVAHAEGSDFEANLRILIDRMAEQIRLVCETEGDGGPEQSA